MKFSNTFTFAVIAIALVSYSNIKSMHKDTDPVTDPVNDGKKNQSMLSMMTGPSVQVAAEAAAYLPLGYVVSQCMITQPVGALALGLAGATSVLSEAAGPENDFSNYLSKMATGASALTFLHQGGYLRQTAAAFGALTTPATAAPIVALFTVYAADKGLDYTEKGPSFLHHPAFKTFTNVLFKLLAAYTAYILLVNAR